MAVLIERGLCGVYDKAWHLRPEYRAPLSTTAEILKRVKAELKQTI